MVIERTTFGGVYVRSLLFANEQLKIRRVRCRECSCTHAVLPAFLLGQVRYPTATLTPYLELAHTESLNPVAVWQLSKADGPADLSTLYRWLRRLRGRLTALLPFLHEELLELAPETILKASSKPLPQLSTMALCEFSWWFSEQLLTLTDQLLQHTVKMSPVAFLNYLCWRKTGVTLLSSLANPPP